MVDNKNPFHLEDLKRLTRHARSYLHGIKTGEVFIKGENISYLDAGEGEVVLLIHGYSSTKTLWRMQMTPLMKRFRVIALEVPGLSMRYEMNNPKAFSLRFLTELVEEFCSMLSLERPHVVGTSTGSILAANYCLKYPNRPKSLTMLGMPMLFKEPDNPLHDPEQAASFYVPTTMEGMKELGDFLYLNPPQFSEAILKRVLNDLLKNREQMTMVLKEFFKGAYQVVPRLGHIEVPTLFIYGDHDRVTPQKSVDVLTRTIPNLQSYCLENTGHVSFIESPNEVAALFTSFVRYVDRATRHRTPEKTA